MTGREPGTAVITGTVNGAPIGNAVTVLFETDDDLILTFVVQPSDARLGEVISPFPAVLATTRAGTPVAGVEVTLAVTTNNGQPGVVLGTTTLVTDDDGIASFDNLFFDGNGATGGYRLVASGVRPGRLATVTPATSERFNVRP